jgi:biotin-dependent carboxylase-like uncharacterized protein
VSAHLAIRAPGLGVSIQDGGRHGHRHIGVPLSGALDPVFLAAADGLLGNPADCAGLEVLLAGPLLEALDGPVRIALAGAMSARHLRIGGASRAVPAWSTLTLQPGEQLQVGSPRGVGYIAIEGGLLTPPLLGSRSTYARAGLVHGATTLPCHAARPHTGEWQNDALRHGDGPIRVIPGPQDGHFTAAALDHFYTTPFRVTRQRDRMGLRLAGPALAHSPLGADIVSDGVTPGAIQVPADGQAILLLADCQTVGGYPKIATVIRADLPRLAHLQADDEIRFRAVDADEAAAARAALACRLADWLTRARPAPAGGDPETALLLAANLAGAAVRGDDPHLWPDETRPGT